MYKMQKQKADIKTEIAEQNQLFLQKYYLPQNVQ